MSFLRTIGTNLYRHASRVMVPRAKDARSLHHAVIMHSSEEELDKRFLDFFNRPDLDGWDVRQGMNDMLGLDAVPEPNIIIAVLNACRRVNDYAIAVRFLEAVKDKCGGRVKEIYPWIIQEITPCLCELGIDTPEELGYDKPELCLESVYDIH